MKRKICVVTGSRADYGLLRFLMQGIKEDADLDYRIAISKFKSDAHKITKKQSNEKAKSSKIMGSRLPMFR